MANTCFCSDLQRVRRVPCGKCTASAPHQLQSRKDREQAEDGRCLGGDLCGIAVGVERKPYTCRKARGERAEDRCRSRRWPCALTSLISRKSLFHLHSQRRSYDPVLTLTTLSGVKDFCELPASTCRNCGSQFFVLLSVSATGAWMLMA